MSESKRPHLAWTAAVVGALVLLFGAAWWLWAGTDDGTDPLEGGGAPETPGEAGSAEPTAEERQEAARLLALEKIREAVDASRFTNAAEQFDAAEERFGWSEDLEALASQLELRESAYREALRPIEFRIEALETERSEIYARFSLEGSPVFATEFLIPDPPPSEAAPLGLPSASHFVVLRTSLAVGAMLELVEPGGLFKGERVVFGPVPLNPLPLPEGGRLEFPDEDAPVRSLTVSYRPSPFAPGVHIDHPQASQPVDATAPELMDAVTATLARDDLKGAEVLLDRLGTEHPGNSLEAIARDRLEDRRASLAQNRTRAVFTILELSADPRSSDSDDTKLWATGGEAPSFRASLRTTDSVVLAESGDERLSPYLIPGQAEDPPPGNVLSVSARGSAPLTLLIKDSSPRFSSRVVGAVDLPVTLSELPRGTGTIVIERQPHVLVMPGSEANRIRRVVLRWSVTRR